MLVNISFDDEEKMENNYGKEMADISRSHLHDENEKTYIK